MNLSEEEEQEVLKVMKSQMLTLLHGEFVSKFEEEFARYIGVKHAIAVNTGTAALHIAIAALNIGPGDEVIVPPFTFISSASSILHNNAIPIFADIDDKSYTLDPNSVRNKITEKTKAILPVHLAGICADMSELMDIASDSGIYVIEDAAQSIGTRCYNKKVGSIGHLGCFSFYPSKNITTGEGGMITTNDEELAEQCRLLRHHGEPEWYVYNRLGYNYRMTEIQGAIGRVQLRKIENFIRIRNKNAKYLTDATSNLIGINPPFVPEYCEPAFNYWIGRLDPDVLRITKAQFLDRFPRSKVLYPKPLYKTKLFQEKIAYSKGCPWSCPFYNKEINYTEVYLPIVEKVTQEIFALDIHPKITKKSLDENIEIMKKITEN
ncbi:MAG TPA: DegT/DnrJ/EryC1/StrS family aminotransferase [Candidatus Nanopelagicaceae bacterium]|nr:DegT/DnrJ/EryC1/StrS family aminotransferase [Candidatus Nanopelagicaceae bacterium]